MSGIQRLYLIVLFLSSLQIGTTFVLFGIFKIDYIMHHLLLSIIVLSLFLILFEYL